jgi:sugar lactone lactonase YvrE
VVDGTPHLYITCTHAVTVSTSDENPVKGIVIKSAIIDTADGPQLADPEIVAGLDPNRLMDGSIDCGDLDVASTFRPEHECQPATDVPLSFPREVIADSGSNIYICDSRNQRVRVIGNGGGMCTSLEECSEEGEVERNDGGRLSTFVGGTIEGRSPCEAFVRDGCAPADREQEDPAISSATAQPLGMFLVDDVTLYFSDRNNNRIRRIDLETGLIATAVGRERTCSEREAGETFKGDGGPAIEALVQRPRGITVFSKEDACDSAGRRLYFADHQNHRVRVVDSAGTIDTFAGSGIPSTDTPVDQNSTADPLKVFIKLPRGVAVDLSGRVFISDCRHRIVKVELDGTLSRVVGRGELQGTRDSCNSNGTDLRADDALDSAFLGDGGPAINARLNQPSEMIFDHEEEFFYFSDSRNNRVRRVEYDRRDGSFGTITTVAGNGANHREGIQTFPTNALDFEISFPYGVALDPTGDFLYCTETFGSSRVYSIRLESDPAANTICFAAGGETKGSSGDGDLPLNAQFQNPNALQVDCAGNVYVLDSRNHRLRRFFPIAIDCPP